jgi:N-hydroxyarylamine O-acetyltransferase
MSAFAEQDYLARLGYSGKLGVTEDTLEAVHRAQAYTIPFENFDILLGRGIDLAPEAIVSKLVHGARGGYCFELNQLLRMALEAFGFEIRPLLARVHLSGSPSGRGHMLLLVSLGRRSWIADVGFGGPGLRAPIPFELDRTASHDGETFRLARADPFGTMLQRRDDGRWLDLYSFDTTHVVEADIVYGNFFTSAHPDSFFTYRRVAALPHPNGRTTLYDRRLRDETDGVLQETVLDDAPSYLDALRERFGIVLDAAYEELKPLRPAD